MRTSALEIAENAVLVSKLADFQNSRPTFRPFGTRHARSVTVTSRGAMSTAETRPTQRIELQVFRVFKEQSAPAVPRGGAARWRCCNGAV